MVRVISRPSEQTGVSLIDESGCHIRRRTGIEPDKLRSTLRRELGAIQIDGSAFDQWFVEQQELFLVRRLKDRHPLFKVSPRDGWVCPLARRVATLSTGDQLLQGRIDVTQFDPDAQCSRPELFIPKVGAKLNRPTRP